MTTNTRFITSVVKTAKDNKTVMPWTRGKRRKAFIEKRLSQKDLKSA